MCFEWQFVCYSGMLCSLQRYGESLFFFFYSFIAGLLHFLFFSLHFVEVTVHDGYSAFLVTGKKKKTVLQLHDGLLPVIYTEARLLVNKYL